MSKNTSVVRVDTNEARTNTVLQRAVNEVAAAGSGVVEVPAGVYEMRDALHLRSGVDVIGEPGTVFRKVPGATSKLTNFLGYGHYELTVEDPELFDVGAGVLIADKNAGGFYTTVATITARRGDTFFIDRMFNHDYLPQYGGIVTGIHSLIEGVGVSDVKVENLTLDGYPEHKILNGCRGGGVFLLQSQRVLLKDIEVSHFYGDAVSFQQCADIEVLGCELHHSRGGGLHPGSGSVRYVMANNHLHHNAGCGIFYCLRTTHSWCLDNRVEHNGEVGISIGERDTDHFLRGNQIAHNNGAGILFREVVRSGADRVHVEANRLRGNCVSEGKAEIEIMPQIRDVVISHNEIETAGKPALYVEPGCSGIFFFDNRVNGAAQSPGDTGGAIENIGLEAPREIFPTGPRALPLDGAWHLNIETLPEWQPLSNEVFQAGALRSNTR